MPLGFSSRFGEARFSRSRFSTVATLYGFNPFSHKKEINLYTVAGSSRKDLG